MSEGTLESHEAEETLELLGTWSRSIGQRQEVKSKTRRGVRAGDSWHVEEANDGSDSNLPEGRQFILKGVEGCLCGVGTLWM